MEKKINILNNKSYNKLIMNQHNVIIYIFIYLKLEKKMQKELEKKKLIEEEKK